MPELNQQPFLTALMEVIDRNLPNELFGVSELADAMNMSRSNLLRKVKRETNLSVSQLISFAPKNITFGEWRVNGDALI